MIIECVEQIELSNIMELSITGQVLRWARQSNLSGGVSLREADGWNIKNVTIREGEEKGICGAVMRELLRIVKDQIGEACAFAMVLSRMSTIWRRAIVKKPC